MRRARRPLLALLALLCAALAVMQWSTPHAARAQAAVPAAATGAGGLVAQGRGLFVDGCASCHGLSAEGVPGRGPSLQSVGAEAADFYLSTGRMPLNNPHDAPVRVKPAYTKPQRAAITAYVASLGGPPIPAVDPAHGSLSVGQKDFTTHCAGCHQVLARGGIATPAAVAPSLQEASATQVAEAVRIGPYLMPKFGERQIDQHSLESIARYVLWTRHPDDAGGWGIGNIGPIPEGMVAWFLALAALVIVARLIGERTPT